MSDREKFEEPSRTIPTLAETDVLVVGGGPSGLAAAIAAAREEVEVMLVEKNGFFGGNITKAMVEAIAWYRQEETIDSGGIGCEFEERIQSEGDVESYPEGNSTLLEADIFKIVSDQMVQKSEVTPLFHCFVVDGIVENGKVKGVITESKSGRQAIFANRVIDATGDADIAARVGAPFRKAKTEKLMPATVGFGMSGVNVDKFREYVEENPTRLSEWAPRTFGKEDDLFTPYLDELFDKAKEDGLIPEDMHLNAFWHSLKETGEATGLNMTRISGIDPTDVWDLTEAEIEGRRQVQLIEKALRKYTPGFENSRLRTIGPEVGTRESRIINGQYELSKEEVMNQATFDDSIGIFPEFLDGYGWVILPTTGRYFQVPYRIMVPKKVDNLLVAGRSVAGDRVSHAATRQMMCCAVTGQGAGVAAATSIKEGVNTSKVDIAKVQEQLEQQGVRID